MKRSIMFGVALVLMCGVSGCKKSFDQLAREQIAAINEVTAVLESIQDDTSAQRALPKLEKAAARLKAANDAAQRAQPRGGDPNKAFEKLNDPKVQAHIKQVIEAGFRMMAAQMQAVQKAPRTADKIQAILQKAGMNG